MAHHVADCDGGGGAREAADVEEVVVVAARLVAVGAVADDVEPVDRGGRRRQEVLLDLHGQRE